jgi:dynein heavy chain, axonemal
MGPPGGGRNPVTCRYLRHYNIIGINNFDENVMIRIFSNLMNMFLKKHNCTPEVTRTLQNTVLATISLYWHISETLLPTPAKSHYLFNLRDISRVIQGIQLINPANTSTWLNVRTLTRLWVHETSRVFCDRLIHDSDRQIFYNGLFKICRDKIREDLKTVLLEILDSQKPGDLVNVPAVESAEVLKHVRFGDFMNDGISTYDRPYEEILNEVELRQKVANFLDEYNSMSKKPMALVMFDYAVQHVLRICRVLRMASGNALLIGVGGSGRQSLTKLATFICDFNPFEVEITKSYNYEAWRDDMKELLKSTGLEEKYFVFLLSENQIKVKIINFLF